MTRQIHHTRGKFGAVLVGLAIMVSAILVQVGERGQARVLEDLSAGFAFHTGGFSPLTLGKPLAIAPLPMQELLVTSLAPPSRPTNSLRRASTSRDEPSAAKRRLGLALLLLGILAEEQ